MCRLLSICIAAMFIVACSTEDNPTDSGNDPSEDELIAEADIDEAGGSFGNEVVTITVAPGEFSESCSLTLFEGEEPQQSHMVSTAYRLEGLPRGVSVGVTIEAPEAGPDGNFLQVWDGEDTAYFSAEFTGGMLIGEIITTESERSDVDVIANFLGISGIVTYDYPDTPNRRFHVKVPIHRQDAVNEVLADLVVSSDALETAGVRFWGLDEEEDENVNMSVMEVTLKSNPEISEFSGSVSIYSLFISKFNDGDSLEGFVSIAANGLDASHLVNTRMEAQGELVWELADLALETEGNDTYRHFWIPFAAERWAKMHFGPEDEFTESLEAERILASLKGLYQGSLSSADPPVSYFADGMSEFMLWACNSSRWGLDWFANLLHADTAATPENIILAFGDDLSDIWWHDWVETLVGGEAVDTDDLLFLNSEDGVWVVNEEEDTETTLSADYPDLSACWFSIRLDHDEFTESSSARLSLSSAELDVGDLEIQVFKRLGGELTHLASGGEVLIGGLRQYRIQGAHLLAVVSNSCYEYPYDLTRGADLHVAIEEEPEGGVFDMNDCDLHIQLVSEFFHYEGDDCSTADHWVTNDYMFDLSDGSWVATTFTLDFDEVFTEPYHYRNYGNLSVEMNSAGTEVQSFTLDWTQTVTYSSSEDSEHFLLSWTGVGLLHNESGSWDETFDVIGSAVEDHLSLTHTRDSTANDCLRTTTAIETDTSTRVSMGFSP